MSIANQTAAAVAEQAPADKGVMRAFGRFSLRKLIAKSECSMVWLALDPRVEQEVTLTLPRVQPLDAESLEAWQREVGRAARLSHPHLAAPSEMSVQDHWPYLAVDRAYGLTLGEWLATHPAVPMAEMVSWICQALEGLAFAHEAGVSHGDLQFHSLLINEHGTVRIAGLSVAGEPAGQVGAPIGAPIGRTNAADPRDLRNRRSRAERDVLAMGLIAYRLLSGHSPLDKDDVSLVIARLPPHGREIVRLPWSTARPVPEALRAIVNRATASQERQRYLNARTLLRALNGWLQIEGSENGGPLVLLIDRMRAVGHLPAMPGVGQRISGLNAFDSQRTDELAEKILDDMALTFELLRQVNANLQSAGHASSGSAVITVRRAIALLGLDGVRRAGNVLRAWPGPLNEGGAANLQRLIDQVRLAGRIAQALRPAGYDPEVVFLVVMWQNLGRLLITYHFPEEAQQISLLMRSVLPPGSAPGTAELPGLPEAVASLAVLGADSEAVGAAVAKYWGLGEEVHLMMRRCSLERPIRTPDSDADVLRCVASAGNEIADALNLVERKRIVAAMTNIAKRYGRVLGIELQDLKEAVQQARSPRTDAPVGRTNAGHLPQASEPGQAESGEGVSSPDLLASSG